MQDEKALLLFYKILEKTRSHALKWEQTAEEDQYIVTLGEDLVLTIFPYTIGGYEESPPSVTLGDGKNVLVVMSIDTEGISREDLRELASLAKRIALNIDKSLDAAIKKIDSLKDARDISIQDEDIPF